MRTQDFKYIYGPVSSWRLGSSLGVDVVSPFKGKVCSFDCIYCQIGKTSNMSTERRIFVQTAKIIEELDSLPSVKIDYITFSGMGEPTLAKNLGQVIKAIRKIRKEKIAILTNSSLIDRKDVQKDLSLADFVIAKLDVPSKELFLKVNKPALSLKLERIIKGIKEFKVNFKGKLALQLMFLEENKDKVKELAAITKEINPNEVQINTPLRPCGVKPLSKAELDNIKQYFEGLNAISVYDSKKKKTKPISTKDTLRRRGKI